MGVRGAAAEGVGGGSGGGIDAGREGGGGADRSIEPKSFRLGG
jgi:hypothetical protein